MANPYSRHLVWTGMGLVAFVILAFSYVLITGDGPPIIRQGAEAVRELAFPSAESQADALVVETAPAPASTPAMARKPTAPSPAEAPSTVSMAAPAAAQPVTLAPASSRGTPPPSREEPVTPRTDFYLPGSVSGWTTLDMIGGAPLRIRAGGVVNTPEDSSGPDGVHGSVYERALERRRAAGASERAMAAGPYLALIGRVCLEGVCSPPFVVGATRLLCPAEFGAKARLQLWTNNYVQVDGTRTLARFSSATGGYVIYAEPAPPDACGGHGPAVAGSDVSILTAGQVLRRPEFLVSSSQIAWKPFFVPLTMPLRISASGRMQPRGGARSTGPEGIRVPDQARWVYPGTSDLVVDGENHLYDSRFPYQALIGRLCGSSGCGQTFLIGREYTVCASAGYDDRLELWLNHVVRPEGMLGSQLSVSMEALEMQGRHGEYRFEIARAPSSACNGI